MVSVPQDPGNRNRRGAGSNLPLSLFVGWVLFTYASAFIPDSVSFKTRSIVFF